MSSVRLASRALARAAASAVKTPDAKSAMMVITTMSSISVKPRVVYIPTLYATSPQTKNAEAFFMGRGRLLLFLLSLRLLHDNRCCLAYLEVARTRLLSHIRQKVP